jgi:hypothetical protein
MKRGVFINLAILFTLLFFTLLPVLTILIASSIAEANGCDMSPPGNGSEFCNTLNALVFISGWGSIATLPIMAGILALYLSGVVIYFAISFVQSKRTRQPMSKVPVGMILSTLTVVVIAGLVTGIGLFVNWYRVSYVSACQALPGRLAQNGVQNGSLAIGVKLPYPQGRPEQYVILTVTPDGEQTGMLKDPPGSKDPAWSPDGKQLVFAAQSKTDGRWGLFLSDAQGGTSQALLESDLEMQMPAWAPDGNSLLFQRWLEQSQNLDSEIFSVKRDGSGLSQLPGSPAFDGAARPSPDGRQVVFVSQRDNNQDIYVMNADGSDVRRLTRHPGVDTDPDWSPDGQWIVFASSRGSPTGKNNYHLYTMSPDGTNQCQLTRGESLEWHPTWSPDGQWIAYISLLESKAYRVRPDGTEITALPLAEEIDNLLSLDWAPGP